LAGQGQDKTGGRVAGTPNKSTQKLKTFLDGVFDEAFDDPEFRKRLIGQITTLSIDGKLLTYLLSQWAGAPRQAVDVTASGKLTLEQIVAGAVPKDEPSTEASAE
jgi:hypothetical protein